MNLMNLNDICKIKFINRYDQCVATGYLSSMEFNSEGEVRLECVGFTPYSERVRYGNEVYGCSLINHEDMYKNLRPWIQNVIFNDPATIVFWSDGTKTVVKCQENEVFDPEKGLAIAISKKFLGNKGNYCNEFKKWLPEEAKEEPVLLSATEIASKINEAMRRMAKAGEIMK